jgi:periplasmic protein TonB
LLKQNSKMDSQEILRSSLNDIIFRGKNKSYGAYALRKEYPKQVTRATLIGLALFVVLFLAPRLLEAIKGTVKIDDKLRNTVVDITNLPDPDPKPLPPPIPPPLPEPPPAAATIGFPPPKVTPDEQAPEDITPPRQEDMIDRIISDKTQDGVKGAKEILSDVGNDVDNAPPPPPVPKEKPVVEEDKPIVIVEQMPQFPDGEAAMFKYLAENIQYPAVARENGIEGKVFISFVVNTDGSIVDAKVVRGIKGGCDEEALRVVRMMPKWKPGKQQGRAVRVLYNLPINFRLER